MATLLGLALTASSQAAILTGSGLNLPLPVVNPTPPFAVAPTYASVGAVHTGTWNVGTVEPNWVGTFGMSTPPLPSLSTGSTTYDFTSLPLGYLPAGTFFVFGDVDGGSGNPERYNLQAFDSPTLTTPETSEWLDDTYAVGGVGTGIGGTIQATDVPAWDWNITNPDFYQIYASPNLTGNPSMTVTLQTNQPIYGLSLEKPSTHYGFNILAPIPGSTGGRIPEPTSAMLLGLAGLAGVWRRRS